MTIAEQRFMECVPSALKDIAKALQTMNEKMDNKVAAQPETSNKVVWVVTEDYCQNWNENVYTTIGVFSDEEKAKTKAKERFDGFMTQNPHWIKEDDSLCAEEKDGYPHGHIDIAINSFEVL